MTFASIISYCTNDFRFIGKCIEEASLFSDTVLIPVCDHLFDGTPENRGLLDATYARHPDCQFIEFAYSAKSLYNPFLRIAPEDVDWPRYWHSTARYIGYMHLPPEVEYVLFLDCDEIPEGARFADWLHSGEYKKWNAVRLLAYYYVLRPDFRANLLQSITLLVRKAALSPRFFHQPDERDGMYRCIDAPKIADVRAHSGKPLIHHYSWVRTREESLRKANAWSHRSDEDWPKLIERAFSDKGGKNLFGTDLKFAPMLESPYFDPFSVEIPVNPPHLQQAAHVKKIDKREVFRMEIDALL